MGYVIREVKLGLLLWASSRINTRGRWAFAGELKPGESSLATVTFPELAEAKRYVGLLKKSRPKYSVRVELEASQQRGRSGQPARGK